ncbi:MAG: transcription termination factor NusA [bacterium]|nr:transcription termination factor NusA [bacterium]
MNSNPSQSENIDLKSFTLAISQIAEEKGISKEKVIETIEQAYAAAYKKDYGERGQVIRAKISPESGEVKFWQVKLVVDDSMILSEEESEKLKEKKIEREPSDKERFRFNPEKHIMATEAKKISPKIKPGKEIEMALESHKDYGRIAAQTAKQVILQKIREAEREAVFGEYKSKEGEIISGIVQRIEGNSVFLDIGKISGVLPREEQVPGEFYRPGQRIKVYILKVEETSRGPVIFLSRAYPKLISKLFELEVPEISTGQVLIKSIAREAGSRSKIAVFSETEGIDPIGSAVGQKGTRVGAVISELGGEKIDIIEYSEESEKFIANSLSPAKVLEVKIGPKNKAVAIVPEDQLSLAIGRDGQNVRLAAKLTGWKIDVRSPEGEKEEKGTKEKEETKEKKEAKKKTKTVKK